MKVLYLNPSGQLGGAEIMLLNLMASLRGARPDWSLQLISGQPGALLGKAAALGVHVLVVPFPAAIARLGDSGSSGPGPLIGRVKLLWRCLLAAISAPGYLWRLRRAIRANQPDLIHANGFKMHIFGAWSGISGVPLVWHVNDYVRARPLMGHFLRSHAGRAAAAIAVSESVAEDVKAVCRDRLRVFRLYNGIDLESFSPAGPALDLDALSGMPPPPAGAIRIGLVATFARWKGHETFLRAIGMLPAGIAFRAYIVGDAVYQTDGSQYCRRELREMAVRWGVHDRVGFTGFVSEPGHAMRSLDIVVHASTAPEPFGMVIAEAFACGRAVVVSQAGGASELFTPGRDALGHTPGDAAELAGKIWQLASNSRLRATLGAAARITAVKRFDRTRVADDLVPIYHEIAGSSFQRTALLAASQH